jgi:hypothetical protein
MSESGKMNLRLKVHVYKLKVSKNLNSITGTKNTLYQESGETLIAEASVYLKIFLATTAHP